jgi:hypothetical protein
MCSSFTRIYKELDMEDKILLIHGTDEALEEIKGVLKTKNKDLGLKYVSISDKEEFEKRFDEVMNDKLE